jgi:hypothetical protein
MRKSIIVFGILSMLVAVPAWAGFSGPRAYFSDALMTSQTGADFINCNGSSTWAWGTTSTYRRLEGLHCETANDVILCHRWTGTSWVSMPCPY